MTFANQLAKSFDSHLRAALTPEQYLAVRIRNALDTSPPGTCASHDLIDANMVMAAAFLEQVGREVNAQDPVDAALWGEAWTAFTRKVDPLAEAQARQLYLRLLHGRTDPEADMDEVGTTGPLIGPFEWLRVTYNSTMRLGADNHPDCWVTIYGDMLACEGVFYGDWEIVTFDAPPEGPVLSMAQYAATQDHTGGHAARNGGAS